MAIGRIGGVSGGDTILETYRYNASGGETSLSGADASGKTLVYPANYEAVFLNGVRLARGLDYTATTGNSITGLAALAAGDVVEIAVLQSLDVVQVDYADVRFAAEAPSNPVNGTVWIDSDATVDVANFVETTGANTITVASGNEVPLTIQNNGTGNSLVVNDVASDTTPFVVDASGNVGIGTSVPAGALHIDGGLAISQRYASSGAVVLRRANGTASSPTASVTNDTVGILLGRAFDGSNYRDVGSFYFTAAENISSTASGGIAAIATTPIGSTGAVERLRIDATGRVTVSGGVLEAPVVTNAQTTSYTLVITDAGKLIEINSVSATTLTIPADASVNFSIGTKIDVLQTGAGQVTIAGSGFTPNATPGLKISAQWGAATLIKRGVNSWVVIGNLSA